MFGESTGPVNNVPSYAPPLLSNLASTQIAKSRQPDFSREQVSSQTRASTTNPHELDIFDA
jgi:hypothetical protein